MSGEPKLIAQMLYGSGLRMNEAVCTFSTAYQIVREGSDGKLIMANVITLGRGVKVSCFFPGNMQ